MSTFSCLSRIPKYHIQASVINEPPHGKTNNLHRRKQRRRKLISAFVFATRILQFLYFLNLKLNFMPLTIFYDCTARFVSDLVRTQIVGFLTHRLICMYQHLTHSGRTAHVLSCESSLHYVPLPTLMVRFDQNNFRLTKRNKTWMAHGAFSIIFSKSY